MVSRVLFSSKNDGWRTPRQVFKCLSRLFGPFDLDPCASRDNHLGIPHYYTEDDDGLRQPWFGRVYVNPPYGKAINSWIEKAIREVEAQRAERVVMLLPARTDTRWFHELILEHATGILFVKGRIKFEGARESAPFPSMIVIFDERKRSRMIGAIDMRECTIKKY